MCKNVDSETAHVERMMKKKLLEDDKSVNVNTRTAKENPFFERVDSYRSW